MAHLAEIRQVAAPHRGEHHCGGNARNWQQLKRPQQTYRIRDPASGNRAGGQPQNIVGQRQCGKGRSVNCQRSKIGDHCASRACGSRNQKHRTAQHHQLGRASRELKRDSKAQGRTQAVSDRQCDFSVRPVSRHSIAQHPAQHHACTAHQQQHRRQFAGTVNRQFVIATEIAGQPSR